MAPAWLKHDMALRLVGCGLRGSNTTWRYAWWAGDYEVQITMAPGCRLTRLCYLSSTCVTTQWIL